MKPNLRILPIILMSILLSNCGHSDERKDLDLDLAHFQLGEPRAISAVKEYIKENNGQPARVYTLIIHRENKLLTSFHISSIVTFSELKNSPPSGFFTVDGEIILLYTGIEAVSIADQKFFERLEAIIGDKLAVDVLSDGTRDPKYLPLMFDPATWEVKLYKDSTSIEKGVMDPLGPPLTKLKFITPKQ